MGASARLTDHDRLLGYWSGFRAMANYRTFVGITAAASVALSGCVTDGVDSVLGSRIDPNDTCGAASKELRDAEGYFARSMLAGALTGAAIGAIGAALLAEDGERGDAALEGAAIGAVAGAGAGYLSALQQEASDRQELLQTFHSDVSADSAEIARAVVAFQRVRDCRLAQAEQIKAAFQAGTMSREAAQTALDRQREYYRQDIAAAEQIGAKFAEREKEYEQATLELIGDDEASAAYVQRLRDDVGAASQSANDGGSQLQVSANSSLRMRAGPGTTFDQVGGLAEGEVVTVLEQLEDDWFKIAQANGAEGYVAGWLTTPVGIVAAEAPSAAPAPPPPPTAAAGLAVPLYAGVEKRQELEQEIQTARQEETSFTLT